MLLHVAINPDAIHAGDQLTLQDKKGACTIGTVVGEPIGGAANVEFEDGFRKVRFGGHGRRDFTVVGHQPRLV